MQYLNSFRIVKEEHVMTNKELQSIYRGAYFFRETEDGWLQAFQYSQQQMDYFESCIAKGLDFWYDRCMASSAKTLELTTTAGTISFEYRIIWKGSQDSFELAADGLITDRTAVVINMGVNDLANAERYAEYVNELYSRWTGRGAKVWYMSVNPVGPQASVTNEQIDEFNSTMREKLGSGIKWIDTNSMLMQQGFTAGDSLHYDEKTYQKIYDYVFRALGLTT